MYARDIDAYNKVVADILGSPVKPAGVKPTKSDKHLARDYGGIQKNQTLFKKVVDGSTIIAMFWPWRDQTYATLKMAVLRE